MHRAPTILPLDANGKIYAIQDETGNTIGTGSREVCEVLLYMITKHASRTVSGSKTCGLSPQPNVPGAIGR